MFTQVPERDLPLMIEGSMLLLGNSVMFCRGIVDKEVLLVDVKTQESTSIPLEALSLINPYLGPLGYVNTDAGAGYIYRRPRRQYRAGITTNNIATDICSTVMGTRSADRIYSYIRRGFSTDLILQPREGNYPSIEEAVNKAQEQESVFAFNKWFAVDYLNNLLYKNRKVGEVEEGQLVFDAEFEILGGIC